MPPETTTNLSNLKTTNNPTRIYKKEERNLNCIITNPNTNYQFNTTKLNINVSINNKLV